MLLKRPCAAPGVSLHVGVNGRILLRIRERAAYALLTRCLRFWCVLGVSSSTVAATAAPLRRPQEAPRFSRLCHITVVFCLS